MRDPSTLHGYPTVAAHAKHGGPSCAKGEARHFCGLCLALALPPRINIQASCLNLQRHATPQLHPTLTNTA